MIPIIMNFYNIFLIIFLLISCSFCWYSINFKSLRTIQKDLKLHKSLYWTYRLGEFNLRHTLRRQFKGLSKITTSNTWIIHIVRYLVPLIAPKIWKWFHIGWLFGKKESDIKLIIFFGAFIYFVSSLFLLQNSNLENYGNVIMNNNSLFLFCDGIAIFFIILTTFITLLCVIASHNKIANLYFYFICLLTLDLLLILSFSTWNLLWFYIFFEAILIPMFIMIIRWGSRERKIKAAFYLFCYTVGGSFFMLIGILFIYMQTQTLNINQLVHYKFDIEKQKILWFCFFVGFSIKIPTVPMHLWLPEAHVEAPTTGSVILASLLLKLGGYGFLRISLPLFPLANRYFLPLVNTLCLISICYASIIALRQIDIKKIIAYTSIAHMNLIVLGIFSSTIYGLTGAIFLMIAHGIVSGALFFIIGVLYERFHTRLLNYFGGFVHFMPLFATLFCIFSLGNLGFPGSCNFIGEFLILLALLHGNILVGVIAATTMVYSAAYSLWVFNRVIFGNIAINQSLENSYVFNKSIFAIYRPRYSFNHHLSTYTFSIKKFFHVSTNNNNKYINLIPHFYLRKFVQLIQNQHIIIPKQIHYEKKLKENNIGFIILSMVCVTSIFLPILIYISGPFSNHIIDFPITLFIVGFIGLFFAYKNKNLIIFIMCIETILLGIILGLIVISLLYNHINGQIYALCILSLAACETAIGLGLIVQAFGYMHTLGFHRFRCLR
jgi:NADH-quinone oxidoreductase subunit M